MHSPGTSPSGYVARAQSSSSTNWGVSIVGIFLYVIIDGVAQSLPPHYSPIRDAESDLAVGPYGYIMGINFVNRGILSLVFIYAFVRTIERTGGPLARFRRGYYFLGFWAIGAIILAFFPTDVPSTPISWHGAIHLVVALIAFVGGAVGILLLSRQLGQNAATRGARRFGLTLGWLPVLLLVLDLFTQFLAPRFARGYFGLTERLFLGSVLLWILVISAYMIAHRRSMSTPLPPESAPEASR